ncbi:L,D-transpeptidase [Lacticaseibacillus mingshuiensis]|uniref:L,D-transpeptidase n=1 Tax=Lacticaseibacillus mingshuiensis TaxID=2799574 RepID=A0ABW4CF89_9LACO|nr:L,D-transpeptidase [Lacticaseibacillus mingshuiensis]
MQEPKWRTSIRDARDYLKAHRLKRRVRYSLWVILAAVLVAGGFVVAKTMVSAQPQSSTPAAAEKSSSSSKAVAAKAKQAAAASSAAAAKASSAKASSIAASKKAAAPKIDWQKPSEAKAYPDLNKVGTIVLDVSLAKQRVYVKSGNRVLYTMYASTGMDDSTPHGDFTISSRGKSFYNPNEKMGANYWTNFLDNLYLFHSVPTDENQEYILSETRDLGIKPSSHGCVRLSVPDAKWINEHVPDGTKVHIA